MARRRYSGKNVSRNTSALQFFTDRETERSIIKRFFQAIMQPETPVEKPVLNFYGVGGAGKSNLVRKAIQEWSEESPSKSFRVALVDFDHPEAEKNYTPATALWDIRSALARAGIMMYYFDALYAIYWSKTHAGQDANLDLSPLAKAFDFGLDKGEKTNEVFGFVSNIFPEEWGDAFGDILSSAENATSGMKLGFVAARFFANLRNNKKIKDTAKRLGFPQIRELEEMGSEELRRMMAEIFGVELADTLEQDNLSLVLALDGFERIQQKSDIEEAIREFLVFSLLNEDEHPTSRMGSIILGRRKLEWRSGGELEYRKWNSLIESHRLGGLARADALEFIDKVIAYEKENGSGSIAELIEKHKDGILAASCEGAEHAGSAGHHPYYIDLAISIIRDRGDKFDAGKHLGSTPAELQQRFFKYMNRTDRHFHLLLALAIRFDWPLVHAVKEMNVVDVPNQLEFENFVRAHSYVVEFVDRPGVYRLHRLMQDALVDACDPEDARCILDALAKVLRRRLEGIETLSDITPDREDALFHLLDIIYMAWEEKLCDMAYAEQILEALPSAFEEAYFAERAEYLRRHLSCVKRDAGERHPAVATSLNNLASVLNAQGKYSEAEALHREALEMRRELLGERHPDVATSLNNLASVLDAQGKHNEARALLRKM